MYVCVYSTCMGRMINQLKTTVIAGNGQGKPYRLNIRGGLKQTQAIQTPHKSIKRAFEGNLKS